MKLLKIVFVFLLVITIGEALFYIFYLRQNSASKQPVAKTQIEMGNTAATPSSSQAIPTRDPSNALIPDTSLNYLRNDFFTYLELHRKQAYKTFTIIEEDRGIVGESVFDEDNQRYRLTIVDEKGHELKRMLSPVEVLKSRTFNKIVEGKKVPITYSDIKKGDKIRFVYTYDLISSKGSNEYIIDDSLQF